MILDKQHEFSDAQALTATGVSTNLIDLGADNNIGIGEPMSCVIVLDVAADDANGNETYVAALETSSDEAFSSPVSLGSATITRGDAAGTKYVLPVPADSRGARYLRLNFTLGGTTPSATVSAYFIPSSHIENYVAYADNITIS